MDALAVDHLRHRLHTAQRELEASAAAILSAVDRHSWVNVAMHAASAAAAAAQVEAFTAALAAAGDAS